MSKTNEPKNYSLYIYYKGTENYPNKKAAAFGFYEKKFDDNYTGKPEEKEDAFKEYMSDLLYEFTSDGYMFKDSDPQEYKLEKYREYIRRYFEPDRDLHLYEKN